MKLLMTTLAAGVLVFVGVLSAHHSVTAVFDTSKQITVSGELTNVDWVNPHIFLYMKGKPATGGEVKEWKIEGGPPAWYRRSNVTKTTFTKRIGQTLTIEGYPAKDASPYQWMLKVTFADGDTMESISAAEAAKAK
jgi:hypothetical protein